MDDPILQERAARVMVHGSRTLILGRTRSGKTELQGELMIVWKIENPEGKIFLLAPRFYNDDVWDGVYLKYQELWKKAYSKSPPPLIDHVFNEVDESFNSFINRCISSAEDGSRDYPIFLGYDDVFENSHLRFGRVDNPTRNIFIQGYQSGIDLVWLSQSYMGVPTNLRLSPDYVWCKKPEDDESEAFMRKWFLFRFNEITQNQILAKSFQKERDTLLLTFVRTEKTTLVRWSGKWPIVENRGEILHVDDKVTAVPQLCFHFFIWHHFILVKLKACIQVNIRNIMLPIHLKLVLEKLFLKSILININQHTRLTILLMLEGPKKLSGIHDLRVSFFHTVINLLSGNQYPPTYPSEATIEGKKGANGITKPLDTPPVRASDRQEEIPRVNKSPKVSKEDRSTASIHLAQKKVEYWKKKAEEYYTEREAIRSFAILRSLELNETQEKLKQWERKRKAEASLRVPYQSTRRRRRY